MELGAYEGGRQQVAIFLHTIFQAHLTVVPKRSKDNITSIIDCLSK